ncbi:hypothetical protein F4779DRAFT_635521 [Xylariaceae sp. FL0662B]|nr:hypothetical protein F4779DRAFT_635521 [Xylariaceae sp. FL0662B]
MASTGCVENLPVELSQMILSELSDVKTLLSVIHSSPSMRQAFFGYAGPICHGILSQEIDKTIFPIAVALHHAQSTNWIAKVTHLDDAEFTSNVVDFCSTHLKNYRSATIDPHSINLEMAVKISRFYRRAQDIADVFIRHKSHGKVLTRNLERDERLRLVKSIYIFELARLLVPVRAMNSDGSEDLTAWLAFWRCFAPWEAFGVMVLEDCLMSLIWKKWLDSPSKTDDFMGNFVEEELETIWSDYGDRCSFMEKYDHSLMVILHTGLDFFYPCLDSLTLRQEYAEEAKRVCTHPRFSKLRHRLFDEQFPDQRHWYISGRKNMKEALELALHHSGDDKGPRDLWLWAQVYFCAERDFASPLYHLTKDEAEWSPEVITFYEGFGPQLEAHCFLNRETLERKWQLPTFEELVEEAEKYALNGQ